MGVIDRETELSVCPYAKANELDRTVLTIFMFSGVNEWLADALNSVLSEYFHIVDPDALSKGILSGSLSLNSGLRMREEALERLTGVPMAIVFGFSLYLLCVCV